MSDPYPDTFASELSAYLATANLRVTTPLADFTDEFTDEGYDYLPCPSPMSTASDVSDVPVDLDEWLPEEYVQTRVGPAPAHPAALHGFMACVPLAEPR